MKVGEARRGQEIVRTREPSQPQGNLTSSTETSQKNGEKPWKVVRL